jgi:flavodoxin
MDKNGHETANPTPMGSLVVVSSHHHNNTEKIANVIANVLEARMQTPQQVDPARLQEYDLIGFGSGIYSAQHHTDLLGLADALPQITGKNAFIFSTSAILGKTKVAKDHAALRAILRSKGYVIVDEFSCKGFNTNSFLKYFGGMNKGRPNPDDLEHAAAFARTLKQLTCAR